MENTCWGIRVTENLSAQKQTGRTYGMLITLGLSALIIGVCCTQYFMTKKIFAPITHILQVFAQIRESEDYSLRVHIQEKHETGELAAGINELLDYVEQADRKEKERQQKLLQMAENDPLTGIKNKKAIEKEMLSMVQMAVESHEQTGEVLPVPCSIGIVMSQGDTPDYTQLIRKADLAMYQAKENGKNTFVLNVD